MSENDMNVAWARSLNALDIIGDLHSPGALEWMVLLKTYVDNIHNLIHFYHRHSKLGVVRLRSTDLEMNLRSLSSLINHYGVIKFMWGFITMLASHGNVGPHCLDDGSSDRDMIDLLEVVLHFIFELNGLGDSLVEGGGLDLVAVDLL
ncbi:hypothetical protein ACJX0J_007346, partial [Zea mays]